MNYSTCRNECLTIDIMLNKLSEEEFNNMYLDIDIHIERQLAQIESDIKDIEYKLKCKQNDIEMYKWLKEKLEEKRK